MEMVLCLLKTHVVSKQFIQQLASSIYKFCSLHRIDQMHNDYIQQQSQTDSASPSVEGKSKKKKKAQFFPNPAPMRAVRGLVSFPAPLPQKWLRKWGWERDYSRFGIMGDTEEYFDPRSEELPLETHHCSIPRGHRDHTKHSLPVSTVSFTQRGRI